MVDISKEPLQQTRLRLKLVIRQANLKIYQGTWTFEEMPLVEFRSRASRDALAFVRDDEVWSQLVPFCGTGEQFSLFRFEFPSGVDNSGFVGWLASLIKERFGSGVFVVCGSNTNVGGIFDYWGVPAPIGAEVIAFIRNLIEARG